MLKISGSREQDPRQRPKAAAAAVKGRSGRQQPQELSRNLTEAAQRPLCCYEVALNGEILSFQTKRMGTKKHIFDFLIVAGQVRRSPEVAVTKKHFLIKKFLSIQN